MEEEEEKEGIGGAGASAEEEAEAARGRSWDWDERGIWRRPHIQQFSSDQKVPLYRQMSTLYSRMIV